VYIMGAATQWEQTADPSAALGMTRMRGCDGLDAAGSKLQIPQLRSG
jgi:hypothetical protein